MRELKPHWPHHAYAFGVRSIELGVSGRVIEIDLRVWHQVVPPHDGFFQQICVGILEGLSIVRIDVSMRPHKAVEGTELVPLIEQLGNGVFAKARDVGTTEVKP